MTTAATTITATAIPAMSSPEPPSLVSAAGLVDGDGAGAADVAGAVVGDADVGAGLALVGDGEGLAATYEKVIPPSTGWPSCETTR